jgi:hypothetical protein
MRASLLARAVETCIGARTVVNPMSCLGFPRCTQGIVRVHLCTEHQGSKGDLAVARSKVHRRHGEDGRLLLHIGGIRVEFDAPGCGDSSRMF